MTTLVWDAVGEKRFKSGIDRGVLYSGETELGVVWNGLVAIDEKIDETTVPLYQDGVKYIDTQIHGNYAATLRAFTYPDEFEQYDGISSIADGLDVYSQPSKLFHLAYRTKIGNDVDGSDFGYQIHLVYNLTAIANDKSYATLTQQTLAMLFSWNIFGAPIIIEGFRPTSHIILDSTEIDGERLTDLEDILYGTDVAASQIPTFEDLLEIVSP